MLAMLDSPLPTVSFSTQIGNRDNKRSTLIILKKDPVGKSA